MIEKCINCEGTKFESIKGRYQCVKCGIIYKYENK